MKKSFAKRLVLLDAHAIIHRAYHALPEFTGPGGEPTGALYGLVSMLLKIIQDLSPDYLIACYDLPKPTIRHEAYKAYKATRKPTDESLVSQIVRSRDVFKAFCIPIYEHEGFEADDILGTITEALRPDTNIEIIIASGDMDTLQLVEDSRVRVYTLKKGLNDTVMYDAKAVEMRYRFPPALVPDYKGLRGDPSDNIIGVPGIGEKTATELLTLFGTLENLYYELKRNETAFAAKGVKPRMVKLLKEHEEDARFSKILATIRRDAPIVFSLPAREWSAEDRLGKILKLFDELGFRSLRARVHAIMGGSADAEAEILEEFPLDSETIDPTLLKEAEVMLWLLASDFTNPTLDDILAFTKTHTFDTAYEILKKETAKTGRLKEVYESIEKPLIPVIKKMELHGVLINRKKLEGFSKTYHAELGKIEKRIHKASGGNFNINSPKQLGEILFDRLGLKPSGSNVR